MEGAANTKGHIPGEVARPQSEGAALRVKRHFQICAGGPLLVGSWGAYFCRWLSPVLHARTSGETTETGKAAEQLV